MQIRVLFTPISNVRWHRDTKLTILMLISEARRALVEKMTVDMVMNLKTKSEGNRVVKNGVWKDNICCKWGKVNLGVRAGN